MPEPEPPLISVIVPAYNEELWLERCLGALLRQQTDVRYEVIVVDNNSTDGTASRAEELGVRVVHEPRKGLTFARQAGQDAARGAIVVHTDADSEAPLDWIESIAQQFAQHPEIVLLSGPMSFPKAPLFMHVVAPVQNLLVWLWWLVTRRLAVVNGCNFAVRAETFAIAGGFPLQLPMTGDSRVLAILKPYGKARWFSARMRTSARRFHGQGTLRVLTFYARQQIVALLGREKLMTFADIRGADGWAVRGKRRRHAALALLPALPLLAVAGSCTYQAINPTSQWYGSIVLHGPDQGEKVVALTFDDGPNEPYTSQVLDVLQSEQVHATFFAVGVNVEYYPDAARRIVDDGNVIANHTYDHSRWAAVVDFKYSQVVRDQDVIQSVTGVTPRFFRPPAGIHTPWQLKRVASVGLTTVNWDSEGLDWQRPTSADRIEQKVLSGVHPGSIILLHDGDETRHGSDRSQTVEALPSIIETLRGEGYRFVTLPELLHMPAYQ